MLSSMFRRSAVVLAGICAASPCLAGRILLVPLDSRPAAGQFAQMIGRLAGTEVNMPPYEILGRYTKAGNPEAILDWLAAQDYTNVEAVVMSTDMLAYGGLISSRIPDTGLAQARTRLGRLAQIRKAAPRTKFYAFSAIMRLFPTATRASRAWRTELGRYAEVKERVQRTGSATDQIALKRLAAKIPSAEVQRYEAARTRNHTLQKDLVAMTARGLLDYLVLGQDDAKPNGPHVPETVRLKKEVDASQIAGRVYFCEGIDQLGNILVSRALLRAAEWMPKVRFVYSDPAARTRIAEYESKTIEKSLRDQIVASGARPAGPGEAYDFTVFLNVPNPGLLAFQAFLGQLAEEVDQGFPACVSDINLGKDGTGDPKLFALLQQNGRMMRLLSYAGWNTAGNTMGTAIPSANVYLLARRLQTSDLEREVAQKEFLLHRFVNDFAYHRYTRPQAYNLIDAIGSASREETYGNAFSTIDAFVRRDVSARLDRTFREQFAGKKFFAGSKQYVFSNLEAVKIFLPWPRAYEVRIEFRLQTQELADSQR